MRFSRILLFELFLMILPLSAVAAPGLDEIVAGVESRYGTGGFTARFFQESTLKAMDITDTAVGRVWVKPPGKMRWEYEAPDRQIIISDGETLWIYRPEDRQVMIGRAPEYFGGGKGASFLSDMTVLRKHFTIRVEPPPNDDFYGLELIPREKSADLASIHLTLSKKTFEIVQVVTTNAYGDETRIEFSDLRFNADPESSLFQLEIPKGTDVIGMER